MIRTATEKIGLLHVGVGIQAGKPDRADWNSVADKLAIEALKGRPELPVRAAYLLATPSWCTPEGSISLHIRQKLRRRLGYVDDVKTEYSRDYVPLHESLAGVLLAWEREALPTEEGWVFASPLSNKPYFPTEIQKRHIRPAGCCLVECPKCQAGVGVWCSQVKPTPNGKRLLIHEERQAAAGKFARIGWHTFRHTYRSWLDETGAPMKVQQELMRHASIQTTMNVYGQAMSSSKREANSKIVEMVLRPARMSA